VLRFAGLASGWCKIGKQSPAESLPALRTVMILFLERTQVSVVLFCRPPAYCILYRKACLFFMNLYSLLACLMRTNVEALEEYLISNSKIALGSTCYKVTTFSILKKR
jgi:hypothetical protein